MPARAQVGRCAARWEAWLGPEARLPVLVACSEAVLVASDANYSPLIGNPPLSKPRLPSWGHRQRQFFVYATRARRERER